MSHQIPHFETIAAIIPNYDETGDTTRIITTDGASKISPSRIRTVVRRLAFSRALDLTALKKQSSHATQRAIMQPLPLAPGLLLCPVKVRTPLVAGDTSTGYINFYAVKSVETSCQKPYQSVVKLSGGASIPVLWTASTVNRYLQYARLALTYSQPYSQSRGVNEQTQAYAPELVPIIQKFVEVICDIVTLKQKP